MTIRICRLYGQSDLRLESMDDARPGPGEVLVAIGAGGICGSDLHYWQDGGFGPVRVREPIILGHEVAGTVAALGTGVDGLRIGQQVALNPSHPCGSCLYCREGNAQHCLNMRFKGSAMRLPHEQGMFRDRLVIGAAQCLAIADGVPMAEAALAEPLAVCLRAMTRATRVAGDLAGKRVLVTGAGPIGALCVALAVHQGAAEVVVTDLQDTPLAVAAEIGASAVVNVARNPQGLAPWMEDKGRFDLAFECSAAGPALRTAIAALRPLGTLVQVGVTGDVSLPLNLLVAKELNHVGSHRFHREFAQAVDLINGRALRLAPIVTHSFAPEEVQEAMATAADRSRAVKVQITFG